jgi:acyl carrier protein
MTDSDVRTRLARIVSAIAGPGRTPADAGPDTPLGEDGYWLDSVDVLEVVLAAEREFGIAFEGESDLTPGSLSSIRTLAELISDKLAR